MLNNATNTHLLNEIFSKIVEFIESGIIPNYKDKIDCMPGEVIDPGMFFQFLIFELCARTMASIIISHPPEQREEALQNFLSRIQQVIKFHVDNFKEPSTH